MLFILRQIRRSFFQPGKLKTYLAYALGEILLIVIGILIAVQIGEWRENRANEKLREDYIQRLIDDIELDFVNLANFIRFADRKIESADLLLASVRDPAAALESPVAFMAAIRQVGLVRSSTNVSSNTFEELRSSGLLRLLNDKSLQVLCFRYYNIAEGFESRVILQAPVAFNYYDRVAGILTNEQHKWITENMGWFWAEGGSSDEIELPFSETELMDMIERFRSRDRLIDWLPELQYRHQQTRGQLERSWGRAEELMAALKQSQTSN